MTEPSQPDSQARLIAARDKAARVAAEMEASEQAHSEQGDSQIVADVATRLTQSAELSGMLASGVTGSANGRVAGFALRVARRKFWVSVERLTEEGTRS